MPNRIIKESLCASEKIASLSDFEFQLWIGLITQADDAGRGDARPAIIRGRVFPFRDRLSIKDIDVALQALAAKGCVSLYTVDGRPYFWFPGWVKHQRVRDCKPKYPEPTKTEGNNSMPQVAASCGELPQDAALIKSESESNPNPKSARVDLALFDRFYAAYPRKQGKSKAMDAFKKLSPDEALLNAMLSALEVQKTSAQWTKDGGQFIPHPATWLNQRRWEDEAMPQNGNGGMRKSRSLNGAHNHHQRTYTDADLDKIGIDLLGDEDDE